MSLHVGDTAPPFVAPEVKYGLPIALNNYLHKPVVLTFSGLTWCAPCQFEAPILQEIWQSHGNDVQFIVISVNDDPNLLPGAIQQFGLTMPVIQDDFSIAQDYIVDGTPQTGQSWGVPEVFVLQPSPPLPSEADHHVVCSRKSGAPGPEAALKADLIARIEACTSSTLVLKPGYWEEYDPIPWLDPGPLRILTPEKRDVLISLGISELARNLSDPRAGRRLERLAIDAMHDAARAARAATRGRKTELAKGESYVTQEIKG